MLQAWKAEIIADMPLWVVRGAAQAATERRSQLVLPRPEHGSKLADD
jgi:hypothetical protein